MAIRANVSRISRADPSGSGWPFGPGSGLGGEQCRHAAVPAQRGAGRPKQHSADALALMAAWLVRNRRAIEREERLLGELRTAPAIDTAMLSVALREMRALG